MIRDIFVWSAALTALSPLANAQGRRYMLLEPSCYDCHDCESRSGGLDLTWLDFDRSDRVNFARWALMHDKVMDGEMPPDNQGQPRSKETAEFLAELAKSLTEIDVARQAEHGRSVPLGNLLRSLQFKKEAGQTVLDRTMILYGSRTGTMRVLELA
jgi:hypothetical protein